MRSDLGEYVELGADDQFTLALFLRSTMQAGEQEIALMPVGGQRTTLSFEVASLDQLCDGLRAKGVAFASAEADHPEWGPRTAFLYDPDGNLLCLYTDTSQARPSAE